METYEKLARKHIKGSGEKYYDTDPSTGKQIVDFNLSTKDDIHELIKQGVDSSKEWANTPSPKRGQILLKAGELMEKEIGEFANLMTLEEGKTLRDSMAEVSRSASTLKFYGAMASSYGGTTLPSADQETFIYSLREPLGLVSLITPWNFPLSIPVWKMAPALAAGNSIIIKPSSNTPMNVVALVDVLRRAGLPEGVVNIAVGSGKEIGDEIVENNEVSAVSFTGSVPVGKHIYGKVHGKKRMTRVQLELGGKNGLYVDKNSDLKKAVEFSVRGAFGLTGQSCTATSRLIAHKDVYERYKEALLERIKAWNVGSGLNEKTDMGPVVDKDQYDKDVEYIGVAESEGAKLLFGGKKESGGELFLQPTIFDNVTPDMTIFREEIFGPVLGITVVENVDEAIELVNSVSYGHTSGIVSNDNTAIQKFVNSVDTGMVKVNKPTVGLEIQAPFGAFKDSGANTWKEMGDRAMDFYSREKTVYLGW